jgi:hypothetical protein
MQIEFYVAAVGLYLVLALLGVLLIVALSR